MDSKIIGGTGGGMERTRGVTDFYPTPPGSYPGTS